ncbi:MAG: C-5 cytosine-specific DNA methylase [Bacteriophage sp.]|nr:MAG: C-5 cytosine-specific DNA methylase [Bacteriophage sp.]
MTQKEFEERTGLKLSADGYTEVEECYMNTDLDKDAFCKLWMENPTALKEIERKTVLVRELYEERKCLTNLLIDQAEKWSASDLRERELPPDLYNLDILDGSPPCSTFSIAGNREKDWGKEKKFREGQSAQVLDTLFFDFIALARVLQPKVVVAENVKGLLMGSAIDYVRRIYKDFDNAGYYCQHFLLDASKMGVPQKRERIFFICIRHDLGINFLKVSNLFNVEPYINMEFNEDPIVYGAFADYKGRAYEGRMRELFELREQGDIALSEAYKKLTGKRGFFNQQFCYEDRVCYTLSAHLDSLIPFKQPVYLSTSEVCNISTFPQDYNFCGLSPHYICGMSVPPVMMAQIATRIYEQWLSKL